MANLSDDHLLTDILPFTNVGMDYSGPLDVKLGRGIRAVT